MHNSGDEQLSHSISHGSVPIHEQIKEISAKNKILIILFIYFLQIKKNLYFH